MCMPLRQGAGAGAGISPEFVPGGTPLRPSPRPAPLSNRVDSPHPPLRRGIPIRPSPATPTPPALRAPPPPLPRGGGSHGDSQWEAVSGSGADASFPKDREESAGENRLETGSSPGSPRAVDRGGYRHGGSGPGTRTYLLKAPPPEGGSTWGYPGKVVSRDANPRIV